MPQSKNPDSIIFRILLCGSGGFLLELERSLFCLVPVIPITLSVPEPAVVPTADWTTNAKGKHFLGRENSLWEVPEVTFSRNWEKGGMERKRESVSWQKEKKGVCTAGLNHIQSCSPITWHPLKLFSLNIYSTFAYMRGWALPGKRAEEEAVLIYFTILI